VATGIVSQIDALARVFGHSGRTVDKRWPRVKVARKNPFIAWRQKSVSEL
jgi:hypothetical protein